MSDVTVVDNPTEVVIEIEGGPVLTTTVTSEQQTLITTPAEPVVIDLNSGARGEPGSAVLTGNVYPLSTTGSVGDVYIITGGDEPQYVGAVLEKGVLGWAVSGNIRGPVGGINSVAGQFGPDVLLVKADVGLGNVDNTTDLLKPVSTATQSALDLKANDSAVVKLSGAQTIADVKTFSSAPVVPVNSFTIDRITSLQGNLDGKVTLTGNQTISDIKTFIKTPLHAPETGVMSSAHMTAHSLRMWHDRFRFTSPLYQTSPDGTTWTTVASTGLPALDGRSDTSVAIDHAARYVRWTWDNTHDMAFANIARLVTRWGYVATTPSVIITGESSADGNTWTSRGSATNASPSTNQHTLALSENAGDTYYRVTMQVTGGAASGTVALLHMLEVQTYRHGSQGKGFEIEDPYWWNVSREVGFYNQIRSMSNNLHDLGTSANRWKNGYFGGTVFTVGLETSGLRVGTTATARHSLISDSSGNATWGNPAVLSAPKNETDNGSTYAQGIYTQSTSDGTSWPAMNGVVLTTFHGTERAFQIVGGKNDNKLRWRAAEVASTNGWKPWNIVADDAMVVHLATAESITGVKTFTVSPIVPAPTTDLQASTKKYVDDQIFILTNGSPALLNTLDELAAAIGDDANFATTMTNNLALKAPLASPTFTGTVSGITATMVGLSNITNTTKVDLTTAQTIAGIKTFSSAPVVPDSSFTIAKTTGLQGALDAKAPLASPTFTGTVAGITATMVGLGNVVDLAQVDLVNAQTIAGVKTFSSGLVVNDGPTVLRKDVAGTTSTTASLQIRNDLGNPSVHFLRGGGLEAVLRLNGATGEMEVVNAATVAYVGFKSNAITATGIITGNGSGLTTLNATNLSSGTVAQARLVHNVVQVVHGATAATARPTGATFVHWVGTVAPTNATANDIWWNA